MVRGLVITSLWHLLDEPFAYPLLDWASFQGCTSLHKSAHIADAKTIWALHEGLRQTCGAEVMFYVGYQASVNVDQRGKLIRKIHVSHAGQGDQRYLSRLLEPMHTKRDVYADRGYTKQIAEPGVRDGIQRRRQKEQALTARQQHSNKHVAKTWVRVEQVFGAMQQMGGKLVRCIGLKRADVAIKIKAGVDKCGA